MQKIQWVLSQKILWKNSSLVELVNSIDPNRESNSQSLRAKSSNTQLCHAGFTILF
jgi:hypothetical protein